MRILAEIMWMLIIWSPLDPSVKTVQDCYEKPGLCEGKEQGIYITKERCISSGKINWPGQWSCEPFEQKFAGE